MKEVIRVEKVALPKPELDDGEEDEEEEEEEIKHREVEKVTLLGVVQLDALLGITSGARRGHRRTRVRRLRRRR